MIGTSQSIAKRGYVYPVDSIAVATAGINTLENEVVEPIATRSKSNHPWRPIVSAVKSRFEGILNVSDPIPAQGNLIDEDALTVQTSGTYIGAEQSNYTITISTGGISGVARCMISNSMGDSVVSSTIINSGEEISLGQLRAKIKFTFSGELIAGDSWVVNCGLYNNTIKEVLLSHGSHTLIKSFPSIVMAPTGQDYGRPEGPLYSNVLYMRAELWMEQKDEELIFELTDGLEDIEDSINRDPTLDGVVDDIFFKASDPILPADDRPYGVISVDMAIFYKQVM